MATDSDDEKRQSCGSGTRRWARRKVHHVTTGKFWLRKFPVIGFLRGYNGDTLISDIIAGITIGLTFIPSSMASAVVAGLPPQYGLYSAISCYFIYAIFGSEPCVVVGPTVLTAMLCKPFVDKYGEEIAFTLSFYSGCLVLALGVLNMGFVVHFISIPTLDGFLSAAALSAISGQVAPLFGMSGGGITFVEYWVNIIKDLQEEGIKLWDTVLGVSCIVVILILQQTFRYSKIPENKEVSLGEKIARKTLGYIALGRTAIVVLISTIIIAAITGDGTPPVNVAGNITEGLPHFILPPFTIEYENETLSFTETISELATSITMPLVIIMESMAAAKAFAAGLSVDAVQELIALGSINVVGSFLQSMPCAASVTRTTVNHNAGVKTPMGGLFAGSLLLLALGLFSKSLRFLPDASLAAVVITAVMSLVKIHTHTATLWKYNKLDLIPLYATFLGCLLTGLDYGIIIGILVNMLLLLGYAARPRVEVREMEINDRRVVVMRPDRSVTYPGADRVRQAISKPLRHKKAGMLVVIDGSHISNLDSTAAKVFKSITSEIETSGHECIFWNWNNKLIHKLDPIECFYNGIDLEQMIYSLPSMQEVSSIRPDAKHEFF